MDEGDGRGERGAGAEGLAALSRLLTWTSPAFPIGAFAYSHGLESAIAEGRVRDGEALYRWIETLLVHGSGWNDLVFLAQAHRLRGPEAGSPWADLAALARASAGSAERRRETLDLGRAFAEAAAPWGQEPEGEAVAYPVVLGALAAREGVPLWPALLAFAHAFAANLVSVAVRLVPLGQREGVRVMRRLEPIFEAVAQSAAVSTLDDLGSAAILSDIAALRHETLQPRLFLT
ncbi:urease accessory protein UreF [Aureimonas ureilytica]|uniref:urease accessory protein UreF n=1 Tax=Aureimonas ureilytica TaxID=401562 RepID=UPI003CF627DA